MKYIFLTGSLLFGIAGISQAMGELMEKKMTQVIKAPVVVDLQYVSVTFQPIPIFVKVLLLSFGLFCLFLIWRKLKHLGVSKLSDYIPC